jgi:hypothetical protein
MLVIVALILHALDKKSREAIKGRRILKHARNIRREYNKEMDHIKQLDRYCYTLVEKNAKLRRTLKYGKSAKTVMRIKRLEEKQRIRDLINLQKEHPVYIPQELPKDLSTKQREQ